MTIATIIRRLRTDAGLSVESIADKAGLSRAAIHHIEAGTRFPSLDTCLRITRVLRVSLAVFDKVDIR